MSTESILNAIFHSNQTQVSMPVEITVDKTIDDSKDLKNLSSLFSAQNPINQNKFKEAFEKEFNFKDTNKEENTTKKNGIIDYIAMFWNWLFGKQDDNTTSTKPTSAPKKSEKKDEETSASISQTPYQSEISNPISNPIKSSTSVSATLSSTPISSTPTSSSPVTSSLNSSTPISSISLSESIPNMHSDINIGNEDNETMSVSNTIDTAPTPNPENNPPENNPVLQSAETINSIPTPNIEEKSSSIAEVQNSIPNSNSVLELDTENSTQNPIVNENIISNPITNEEVISNPITNEEVNSTPTLNVEENITPSTPDTTNSIPASDIKENASIPDLNIEDKNSTPVSDIENEASTTISTTPNNNPTPSSIEITNSTPVLDSVLNGEEAISSPITNEEVNSTPTLNVEENITPSTPDTTNSIPASDIKENASIPDMVSSTPISSIEEDIISQTNKEISTPISIIAEDNPTPASIEVTNSTPVSNIEDNIIPVTNETINSTPILNAEESPTPSSIETINTISAPTDVEAPVINTNENIPTPLNGEVSSEVKEVTSSIPYIDENQSAPVLSANEENKTCLTNNPATTPDCNIEEENLVQNSNVIENSTPALNAQEETLTVSNTKEETATALSTIEQTQSNSSTKQTIENEEIGEALQTNQSNPIQNQNESTEIAEFKDNKTTQKEVNETQKDKNNIQETIQSSQAFEIADVDGSSNETAKVNNESLTQASKETITTIDNKTTIQIETEECCNKESDNQESNNKDNNNQPDKNNQNKEQKEDKQNEDTQYSIETIETVINEKIAKGSFKIDDPETVAKILTDYQKPLETIEVMEQLQKVGVDVEKIVKDNKSNNLFNLTKEEIEKVGELASVGVDTTTILQSNNREVIFKLNTETIKNIAQLNEKNIDVDKLIQQFDLNNAIQEKIDEVNVETINSENQNIEINIDDTKKLSNRKTVLSSGKISNQKALLRDLSAQGYEQGAFGSISSIYSESHSPVNRTVTTSWNGFASKPLIKNALGVVILNPALANTIQTANKTNKKSKPVLQDATLPTTQYVNEIGAVVIETEEEKRMNKTSSHKGKHTTKHIEAKERSDKHLSKVNPFVNETEEEKFYAKIKDEEDTKKKATQIDASSAIDTNKFMPAWVDKNMSIPTEYKGVLQNLDTMNKINTEKYALTTIEHCNTKTVPYYQDKDIIINKHHTELKLNSASSTLQSAYREVMMIKGEKIVNYYDQNADLIVKENETTGIMMVKAGNDGTGCVVYDKDGKIIEISPKGNKECYQIKEIEGVMLIVNNAQPIAFPKENIKNLLYRLSA